jgi:hypothetical protein
MPQPVLIRNPNPSITIVDGSTSPPTTRTFRPAWFNNEYGHSLLRWEDENGALLGETQNFKASGLRLACELRGCPSEFFITDPATGFITNG